MATTGSFRDHFDAMVATLRAHPRVEVYEVEVRPPAPEAALAEAEEAIGMPLPADVRAFYAAHDGVFLEWGLRGQEYRWRTPPFDWPDYGQPPGCINLVPVRVAMSPGWETDSHVNVIQPEHQARLFGAPLDPPPKVAAVVVDNYSKYNHGDMILGPEPMMVVCTDHGADMDSSHWCTFSVYLDATLAVWGVDRYDHGFGVDHWPKARRKNAWKPRPTLDEIIAKLDKRMR